MPRWKEGEWEQTPKLFKCFVCKTPFDDWERRPFVCKADCSRKWVLCEKCCRERPSEKCWTCGTWHPNFHHHKELSDYMSLALTNEDRTDQQFECKACSLPFNRSSRTPFVCNLECWWKSTCCEMCTKLVPFSKCTSCKTYFSDYVSYKEFQEYMNSVHTYEDRADQQFECQICSSPFDDSSRKPFVCKLECRKSVACEMCIKLRPYCKCWTCDTRSSDYVPYKEFQGVIMPRMQRWEVGVTEQTPKLFRCWDCKNPFDNSMRKPFVCKPDCRRAVLCEECCKELYKTSFWCRKCKTTYPNFQHDKEFSEYLNTALTNEDRTDQQFECQSCSLPFDDTSRKPFVCKCRRDISCEMCIQLRPSSECWTCETLFPDYVRYKELQEKVREHEDFRMIKFKGHRRMLEKLDNDRKDAEKQLLEYKDTMESIVNKLENENKERERKINELSGALFQRDSETEEQRKKKEDLEKARKDFQLQLATARELNRNLEQTLEKEKNEKMEAEKHQIAYKDRMENIVKKLENENEKRERKINELRGALSQRDTEREEQRKKMEEATKDFQQQLATAEEVKRNLEQTLEKEKKGLNYALHHRTTEKEEQKKKVEVLEKKNREIEGQLAKADETNRALVREIKEFKKTSERRIEELPARNQKGASEFKEETHEMYTAITKYRQSDLSNRKLIGRGGFGDVFRYRCRSLGYNVVVKQAEQAERRVLMDECSLHFKHGITHLHIVRVLGLVTFENDRDMLGIMLEYMEEGDLNGVIGRKKTKEGTAQPKYEYDIRHIVSWSCEIVSALKFLHSKELIHRDLKPQNILMFNNRRSTKLADFGLSQYYDEKTQRVEGTWRYMAPEAMSGKFSPKGDVYSYSIVLWQMIYEKTPFADLSGPAIVGRVAIQGLRPEITDCDGRLKEILTNCWEKDVEKRWDTDRLFKYLVDMRDKICCDSPLPPVELCCQSEE